MAGETTTIPLIRTKPHRPQLGNDHLHRRHILDRPNQRIYRTLTLVSAPADYGKSTLLSFWLDDFSFPNCWINLDKKDNGANTPEINESYFSLTTEVLSVCVMLTFNSKVPVF